MEHIIIRNAGIDDAAAIAEVHVSTWQSAYRGQLPDEYLDSLSLSDRTKRWQEILQRTDPQATTLVAETHKKLVGFCSIGPSRDEGANEDRGELYAIYIDQSVKRQGIGHALLEASMVGLIELGFQEATLWVLKSNNSARWFYEHHGWRADGETKVEERPNAVFHEVRYRIRLD